MPHHVHVRILLSGKTFRLVLQQFYAVSDLKRGVSVFSVHRVVCTQRRNHLKYVITLLRTDYMVDRKTVLICLFVVSVEAAQATQATRE